VWRASTNAVLAHQRSFMSPLSYGWSLLHAVLAHPSARRSIGESWTAGIPILQHAHMFPECALIGMDWVWTRPECYMDHISHTSTFCAPWPAPAGALIPLWPSQAADGAPAQPLLYSPTLPALLCMHKVPPCWSLNIQTDLECGGPHSTDL